MPLLQALRRPLIADAAAIAVLAAASVLLGARTFGLDPILQKAIGAVGPHNPWRMQVLVWWLAAVPALAALVLRHRWPLAAFAGATGAAIVHTLDPILGLLPVDLAGLAALFTVASRARRTALLCGAAAVAALFLTHRAVAAGFGIDTILPDRPTENPWLYAASAVVIPALLLGTAWAMGDSTRTRRLHLAAVQQRADALNREQDQRARLAVAAERARITRELHDVIAHSMSVIVIQAQAATAALPPGSDVSEEALSHVITTGRASLTEMRRLLGIVRAGPDGDQPLDPAPGTASLPALIDQARRAGTPVQLTVEGDPRALPAAVDLSAYRIVQEALTNVRRHAGSGAEAVVTLAYLPAKLRIDVTDNGTAYTAGAGGNGLRGLTERVTALGGTITTGRRDGGGFTVQALLPLTVVT